MVSGTAGDSREVKNVFLLEIGGQNFFPKHVQKLVRFVFKHFKTIVYNFEALFYEISNSPALSRLVWGVGFKISWPSGVGDRAAVAVITENDYLEFFSSGHLGES